MACEVMVFGSLDEKVCSTQASTPAFSWNFVMLDDSVPVEPEEMFSIESVYPLNP